MPTVTVDICFFCHEVDEKGLAVASYDAQDGKTYCVCKKHLEFVKANGIEYHMLDIKVEEE